VASIQKEKEVRKEKKKKKIQAIRVTMYLRGRAGKSGENPRQAREFKPKIDSVCKKKGGSACGTSQHNEMRVKKEFLV